MKKFIVLFAAIIVGLYVSCISDGGLSAHATVTDSNARTYQTAKDFPMKSGESISGTVSRSSKSNGDYIHYDDWYKFTLSKGSRINLTANANDDTGGWAYMTIYSQSDNKSDDVGSRDVTWQSVIWDRSNGTATVSDKLYLSKGTYYIRVFYESNSTTYYNIKFTGLKSWVNHKEPNEKKANAVKLRPGKIYKGMISTSGRVKDYSYYYIDATKGRYYATLFVNESIVGKNRAVFGGAFCINDNIKTECYAGSRKTMTVKVNGSQKKYFIISTDNIYRDRGGLYTFSVTKQPGKPGKVKAKKSGKRIKVTWKKSSGVKGYEIYRSNKKSKGYKKIATKKSNQKAVYIDKKVKKGKVYYYKVRSFKTVNGYKIKGVFSKPVKRKAK